MHLCTGPLYHAAPFGISMALPLSAGVPVVLMDTWDAAETLRLVERHRVTHTHLVPTMFHRLLALPDAVRARHDLSSLLAVVHGAAPCPVEIKRRIIEWLGPILFEYYAATEGPGTIVDSKTWLAKPGTVGRAGDQVLVGDEQGKPLAPGEEGVVWLKAQEASRFDYFKDAAGKTERSYRADGAYYTLGDVGRMDADGYLFLTDRSANLIITGGVNIYPAEVDAVLLMHPRSATSRRSGSRTRSGARRCAPSWSSRPASCRPTRSPTSSSRSPRPARALQVPAPRRLRRAPAARGQRQDLQAPPPRRLPR